MDPLITANTICAPEHLQSLLQLMCQVERLPGVVAEVGVYRGGTARLLCLNTSARVYLIDTFEGLPQEGPHDNYHHKGDFADTSVQHVIKTLTGLGNYTILKGEFPRQNSEALQLQVFKLVHIDVDLYTSVRDCLAFFWPRMVSGGVIVLDDYTTPTCLGAKKATDEFLVQNPLATMAIGPRCQAHITCTHYPSLHP